MDTEYEIIQPPYHLKFREMSRNQAREYFEWFQRQIPIRINILARYIQSFPQYHDWKSTFTLDSIEDLGAWFIDLASTRKRSQKEINDIYANSPPWFKNVQIPEYDLSNETISLAIDVGMYLSQVMVKNVENLHWKMVSKPLNHIDYQQPVLFGKNKIGFNPVHLVLTYAYEIVENPKGPNRLKVIYEIWEKILSSED